MDVGGTLKKARVQRKLSLADVEEITKIRIKYLEAMEDNNFSVLPPGMYGSAFLRSYARFLDLNADELVAAYREAAGVAPPAGEVDTPEREVRPHRGRSFWGLVAALVIVAAAVGLFSHGAFFAPSPRVSPSPKAETRQARQVEPAPPPPAGSQDIAAGNPAGQGLTLVLTATNSYSWYSVTVDNSPPVSGFIYAGQQKHFQGTNNINLILGNAGSVRVEVNGHDLGYLGGQGTVVRETFGSASG